MAINGFETVQNFVTWMDKWLALQRRLRAFLPFLTPQMT